MTPYYIYLILRYVNPILIGQRILPPRLEEDVVVTILQASSVYPPLTKSEN